MQDLQAQKSCFFVIFGRSLQSLGLPGMATASSSVCPPRNHHCLLVFDDEHNVDVTSSCRFTVDLPCDESDQQVDMLPMPPLAKKSTATIIHKTSGHILVGLGFRPE